MKLFVGLGNPGAKYAGNRHNIGFMAMDRLADDFANAPWRAKFKGQVTEAQIGSEKVLLLKPETFMNLSGESVGEAIRFYKLTPADVTVFHDELDLPPSKVKAKVGGGHAGHNGLRSIHAHIGEAYARVRLGIGHPGHKDRVAAYVLCDFAKADQDWIDDLLRSLSKGAADLARGDLPKFSNAVALAMKPADAKPAKPAAPTNAPKEGGKKLDAPQPSVDAATQNAPDTRSPLQKLMDRFS